MVNLKKIELATEEDKKYHIDYWAALFKAKTWEELKMLTKENEYFKEAAEALYVANADEIVRQQCIAREDAERRERTLERNQRLLQEALEEKDKALEEKDKILEEKEIELARLKALLARSSNNENR